MSQVHCVSVGNPVLFTALQTAGLSGDAVVFLPRVESQWSHFPGQLSFEHSQHRLQIIPHANPATLATLYNRRCRRRVVANRFAADVQPLLLEQLNLTFLEQAPPKVFRHESNSN